MESLKVQVAESRLRNVQQQDVLQTKEFVFGAFTSCFLSSLEDEENSLSYELSLSKSPGRLIRWQSEVFQYFSSFTDHQNPIFCRLCLH